MILSIYSIQSNIHQQQYGSNSSKISKKSNVQSQTLHSCKLCSNHGWNWKKRKKKKKKKKKKDDNSGWFSNLTLVSFFTTRTLLKVSSIKTRDLSSFSDKNSRSSTLGALLRPSCCSSSKSSKFGQLFVANKKKKKKKNKTQKKQSGKKNLASSIK